MKRMVAAVAVLALAFAVPLRAHGDGVVVNWVDRGNRATERGKLAEALAAYTFATEQIPLDPVGWYDRGLTYSRLGHTVEALADAHQSVKVQPFFDEGFALIARLEKELGLLDAARSSIEHAIGLKPGEALYRVQHAEILAALHHTSEAASEYEEALRHDAKSARALHGLAEVRLEQRRDREALQALARYAAVAPDDADVNVAAAGLLAKTGRAEDALAWIAAHPSGDPRMLDFKVRALLMLGRAAEAATALPASARGESAYRASLRGELAFRAGRCREAAEAYRAAAAGPDVNALTWRNAGAASDCAKEFDVALDALNRAADLNPRDPLTHRYRAAAYRGLGKRLAAIDEARKALELGGADADLLMMLGVDEYLAGSRTAGRTDYERGCAMVDPSQPQKRQYCAAQLAKMNARR
jgi:tetratricopeptide (TPR) repeat protein